MMTFIAVLLAPLMGIGIATFIIGVFLAPNNIGDSVGSKFQYTGNPKYDCRVDDAGREYCENIASEYYMKAIDGFHRKEAVRYYQDEDDSYYVGTVKVTPLGKDKTAVQDDFDEELPPSDKPAFKPRDDKD